VIAIADEIASAAELVLASWTEPRSQSSGASKPQAKAARNTS
jgi:hypothetical protein